MTLPRVSYGIIGGSGTWGARFPEDLDVSGVKLLEIIPPVATPFGTSAPLKLLTIDGTKVLRVAVHGATTDQKGNALPVWVIAQQVGWIFKKSGVTFAVVDNSVGGIQKPHHASEPLSPWSVVVPDDFIMAWAPPIGSSYSPSKPKVRMRDPFCPVLQDALFDAALVEKKFQVYKHGTYISAPEYRYETESEIRMMAGWGGHIVGGTLGIEAVVMRNYGIHFAAASIVANIAEGHVTWIGDSKESMAEFYQACALPMGRTILRAMKRIIASKAKNCSCNTYSLADLEKFPVPGA